MGRFPKSILIVAAAMCATPLAAGPTSDFSDYLETRNQGYQAAYDQRVEQANTAIVTFRTAMDNQEPVDEVLAKFNSAMFDFAELG